MCPYMDRFLVQINDMFSPCKTASVFEVTVRFSMMLPITVNAPLIPAYGGDQTPKGAYGNQLPSHRFKPYVDPTAYEDPNQVDALDQGGLNVLGLIITAKNRINNLKKEF